MVTSHKRKLLTKDNFSQKITSHKRQLLLTCVHLQKVEEVKIKCKSREQRLLHFFYFLFHNTYQLKTR